MLIVGLGNPGSEYTDNRHNVGFMAVDTIIRRYGFSAPSTKFKGEFFQGEIDGLKIYAIKPMTYMNKSGISVSEIAKFYKIPLEDIYVFYDELDIPVGKIKVKTGGGAGGHNGIKSLDSLLGKDYHRIRIGIDHPGDKKKVHSYVLGNFKPKEREEIDILLEHIAQNISILLEKSGAEFTTKMALDLVPKKDKRAKDLSSSEKRIETTPSKEPVKNKPRNALSAALGALFNKGE